MDRFRVLAATASAHLPPSLSLGRMKYAGLSISLAAVLLDLVLIGMYQAATTADNGNLQPVPPIWIAIPMLLLWAGVATIVLLAARAAKQSKPARTALTVLCACVALYAAVRAFLAIFWALSTPGPFMSSLLGLSFILHFALSAGCVIALVTRLRPLSRSVSQATPDSP